jgi:hypothetical protein
LIVERLVRVQVWAMECQGFKLGLSLSSRFTVAHCRLRDWLRSGLVGEARLYKALWMEVLQRFAATPGEAKTTNSCALPANQARSHS